MQGGLSAILQEFILRSSPAIGACKVVGVLGVGILGVSSPNNLVSTVCRFTVHVGHTLAANEVSVGR